jgi:hypothetical protein
MAAAGFCQLGVGINLMGKVRIFQIPAAFVKLSTPCSPKWRVITFTSIETYDQDSKKRNYIIH